MYFRILQGYCWQVFVNQESQNKRCNRWTVCHTVCVTSQMKKQNLTKNRYFLNPWPVLSWLIVTIFKENFRWFPRIKAWSESEILRRKKCVRCIWVEGRWEVAIVYSWECDILGRPRVSPLCPSITAQYTAYIHYKLHTAHYTLHVEHCNIAMLGQTVLFVSNHHWVHACTADCRLHRCEPNK